jgi:hypothetical protein
MANPLIDIFDTMGIVKIRCALYRSHMARIAQIYSTWPSAAALARDIGESEVTVRQWRNRSKRIPVRCWRKIAAAALLRGVTIPIDWFLDEADQATEATLPASASAGA